MYTWDFSRIIFFEKRDEGLLCHWSVLFKGVRFTYIENLKFVIGATIGNWLNSSLKMRCSDDVLLLFCLIIFIF